jgi:polysaccharide biosynthesis/export protein
MDLDERGAVNHATRSAHALSLFTNMRYPFWLCSLLLCSALLGSGCRHTSGFETRMSQFAPLPGAVPESVTVSNQLDPGLLQARPAPFTLGPGDRLEIEILGQPDTRAVTFVGPDGKIYYSLLPALDVWGLTLAQTRGLLETNLARYFPAPQVELTLREVGSKYVWLMGRLTRPGIYIMPGPVSLLESLAMAGGTARSSSQRLSQDLADLSHSFVMRQGQFLPVNFQRLLREGDTSQNIILQPDDFVFVPSSLAQEVYVLGAVAGPHAVPYIDQMSLVGALSAVGGPVKYNYMSASASPFFKDALLSQVAIVRGSLAEPKIAIVDAGAILKGAVPDVPLEAGDIVYIPNAPFRFIKNYINIILNSFVSTVAANEGIRAGGGTVGVGVSVPVGGTGH